MRGPWPTGGAAATKQKRNAIKNLSFKFSNQTSQCSAEHWDIHNFTCISTETSSAIGMEFQALFAKLRIADISCPMSVRLSRSVRPSVHMEQLASLGPHFHENWYLKVFQKSVEKIQVLLQSDKNNVYFIWRPIYIYIYIYRVIRKSLRDFRPLRYSSRDGHAEGEHVNRKRATPSFCPTLQVLDILTSEDSWQTFLAHARHSRPMTPAGLFVSQRTGSHFAGISCTTHEFFCA